MYNYDEVRRALMAFLRLGYDYLKDEDYTDSLDNLVEYLSKEDASYDLFMKLTDDREVIRKLYALGHLDEEF